MRITRLLTGTLMTASLLGLVPAVLATGAEAATRPIVIAGAEPTNNTFLMKGKTSSAYIGQQVSVERRDRPGARWTVVGTPVANGKGKFRLRIFPAKGSPKTCFRARVEAIGDAEKATSRLLCIGVV